MNTMSKGHLQSIFLGNGPKVGNRQKGSTRLKLVDRRPKSLSDKACFNILRVEDIRQVGAGPSIEQNDEAGRERNDEVGTRRGDDEVSKKGGDDKVSIRR